MAIELDILFQKVNGYDFHLVAGKGGMKHVVNWFQIVETLYGIDMIEENSIIFTTGVNIENDAIKKQSEWYCVGFRRIFEKRTTKCD